MTATAADTGGGQAQYGYGSDKMNDNNVGTHQWISGSSSSGLTVWASLTWTSNQTIDRITIETVSTTNRYLRGATIQYWNGSTWVTDSSYSQASPYPLNYTVYFASARTTTAIRITNFVVEGSQASNPQIIEFEAYAPLGPQLTVATTAGTAQGVYANDTGPGGNGRQVSRFTIAQGTQTGASLTNIQLTASGTGNDSNAYTQVAIYRDENSNNTFDFGTDVQIGTATAFPADNGVLNFAVSGTESSFNASQSKTYFIVTQLNGSTPATPGQTFNFQVSDITVTGTNAQKAGVPSGTINGLNILTPSFNFADASSTSALTVFLGSSNNVCQAFTIAYPNGPADKPASVTVNSLGTAHEVDDLSSVQLWYDSNGNGTFESGTDTQVASGTFSADNGSVTFSMASHTNFTAGDTRRFFVVYNLNLLASDNETFRCYVNAAANGTYGGTPSGLPTPSVTGTPGLVVSANVMTATVNGPSAAASVDSNYAGATGDGALLLDVTLAAAPGGAWTVTSLTFNASGTGSHDTAFTQVALYEDSGNGTWDGASTDTLAAPTGNFASNAVTMSLTNTGLAAGASRRFFLVGVLNGTATAGQTFNANLQSSVNTPPAGGTVVGIPTSASTALIINAAAITVANGPAVTAPPLHRAGTATTYTVSRWRLTAANADVSVNSIAITTGGTGDWTTDVSSVEVWLDDGDGSFNSATDTQLYSGVGGATVTATFTGFTVTNSTSEDLWVRIALTNTAGMGVPATPETWTLSVNNTGDVSVTGGVTVVLGTPSPNSASLGAIEFNVTSFTPPGDLPAGGAAITLAGSGFMAPFTVTIGGIVCPGTAVITGGTSVTGLTVPSGGGTNLPIVVTSGSLPQQTLTQTFSYSNVGTVGGGKKGGGGGGGGCETGTGTTLLALLAMLALAGTATLRRRRA